MVSAFRADVMLPFFHQLYMTLTLLSLLCRTPTRVVCCSIISFMISRSRLLSAPPELCSTGYSNCLMSKPRGLSAGALTYVALDTSVMSASAFWAPPANGW